jgi:peptidoglycan hydrolase CwlO-like protein
VRPLELRSDLWKVGAAATLCALLVAVASASATDAGALEAKLASARDEASSISSQLQATTAELAGAEAEAKDAAAEEEKLRGLLAEGREREAELAGKLKLTRHLLAVEKARLGRSRAVLAERLVAIYESGTPSTADLVFGSGNYEDFVTQSDYLRMISEADSALADRVAGVREAVHREVLKVADLKAEAVAYDAQLEAAHEEIAAVREAAKAAAARLQALKATRESSVATLKSDISEWVGQLQEARLAESEAEAEEEVGRWLGGPYSIPTYIVMCESGGNYSAVNPSSGAGGAYQILPSTWELYGGKGLPNEAPKAEQDRIAAEIWADSGPSAWVCG